jgi:rRNA processing protein Krr1/Pno1
MLLPPFGDSWCNIWKQLVVTTLKKNGHPQSVFNELERKEKRKKEEDKKVEKEYKRMWLQYHT